MNTKFDYLIDSISKKLKEYKSKEIFLEKEKFKEIYLFTFKRKLNRNKNL